MTGKQLELNNLKLLKLVLTQLCELPALKSISLPVIVTVKQAVVVEVPGYT